MYHTLVVSNRPSFNLAEKVFAKLPLSAEELKEAQNLLQQNEKLLTALAEQLREQQKLLAELGKKRKLDDPIEGLDLDRLTRMHEGLEAALAELKKQTDELRQQVEKK